MILQAGEGYFYYSGTAKVIINIVTLHYNLSNLIISNSNLVFILKLWLLLCYFLKMKKMLLLAFYLQTNN